MKDRTEEFLERIKGVDETSGMTQEEREEAFNRGRKAATESIEKGIAIHLMDEMPGMSIEGDPEAMGWNSMVFSTENEKLKKQ